MYVYSVDEDPMVVLSNPPPMGALVMLFSWTRVVPVLPPNFSIRQQLSMTSHSDSNVILNIASVEYTPEIEVINNSFLF